MDSAWPSCIRSMVGGAGLDVCPDRFKTTIMLIMARDSSVRMILFFMYVSMWLHLTPSTCAGTQHLNSNYAPGRPFAMGCNPTGCCPVKTGHTKLKGIPPAAGLVSSTGIHGCSFGSPQRQLSQLAVDPPDQPALEFSLHVSMTARCGLGGNLRSEKGTSRPELMGGWISLARRQPSCSRRWSRIP